MPTDALTNETGWFAQLPKWVFLACGPYPNRSSMLHVYTYLWMRSFSDDEARCWPSVDAIALDCTLSRPTVIAAITNLIDICAIDKKPRQGTNLYRVRSSPPPGVSSRPSWPSQKRVDDDSQSQITLLRESNDFTPGVKPFDPSKRKKKEKVEEEKEMRAPKAHDHEIDKEPTVPPTRDSTAVERPGKVQRELPSGYIRKKASPQRGSLYCAQQFKQRVEVGLQDWVWQLTSNSDGNPSKTNCPALAKTITVWRNQHSWSDAEVIAVIDTFVAMVRHGYLKVNKQETIEPWRVFVANIDKVLAHQKSRGTVKRTGKKVVATL